MQLAGRFKTLQRQASVGLSSFRCKLRRGPGAANFGIVKHARRMQSQPEQSEQATERQRKRQRQRAAAAAAAQRRLLGVPQACTIGCLLLPCHVAQAASCQVTALLLAGQRPQVGKSWGKAGNHSTCSTQSGRMHELLACRPVAPSAFVSLSAGGELVCKPRLPSRWLPPQLSSLVRAMLFKPNLVRAQPSCSLKACCLSTKLCCLRAPALATAATL